MSAGSVGAPVGSTGSAMTDPRSEPDPTRAPRPEPRWGQYADPAPVAADPIAKAPAPVPPPVTPSPAPRVEPRPRRIWDVIITVGLLTWGVLNVVATVFFASLAQTAQQFFDLFAIGEFTAIAAAEQWGPIVNAAQAAILAATIAISAVLLSRRKLAFWVPIAGWGLATLVTSVLLAIVLRSDPAYVDFLLKLQP